MSMKPKSEREAQLARIRALLAKTTASGCTEEEAKAAAAAVDRLLGLYEIDLDEVTVKEQEIVLRQVAGGNHLVQYAARSIGLFTDCKVWANSPRLAYFGFQVDTEIAQYLTALFLRAIDRESLQFTCFNPDYEEASNRAQHDMLTSFGIGMAGRLGERLGELKSKRDFSQKTSGRDLVAIKMPLVDEAFASLGIVLGGGRGRGVSIRDSAAYSAGRGAAEGVKINQGIAARGQVGGRLK